MLTLLLTMTTTHIFPSLVVLLVVVVVVLTADDLYGEVQETGGRDDECVVCNHLG